MVLAELTTELAAVSLQNSLTVAFSLGISLLHIFIGRIKPEL